MGPRFRGDDEECETKMSDSFETNLIRNTDNVVIVGGGMGAAGLFEILQ